MYLGSTPALFLAIIPVKISNYSCLAEILMFGLEAGGTCDLFGSNEKGMKTQQMNFCHPYLIDRKQWIGLNSILPNERILAVRTKMRLTSQ